MKKKDESLFARAFIQRQYVECRRHKRNTANALRFEAAQEMNLLALRDALVDRSYEPNRSVCFLDLTLLLPVASCCFSAGSRTVGAYPGQPATHAGRACRDRLGVPLRRFRGGHGSAHRERTPGSGPPHTHRVPGHATTPLRDASITA